MKRRVAFELRGRQLTYAKMLMHQQFHVMGRDVESRHGNLLLSYGGVRQKSPYKHTASLYTFHLSKRRRIAFRGFGVFLGDDAVGGIFVNRREFEVRWMRSPLLLPVPWFPSQSPPYREPRTGREKQAASELLAGMVDWFYEYEEWIQLNHGRHFRIGQLVHFKKRGNDICNWEMQEGWKIVAKWLS